MLQVLTHMAALILCGIAWRIWRPLNIDADYSRRALTGLVYVLLLPALVLSVLWKAPLGWESSRLALAAASGILTTMALAWAIYRFSKTNRTVAGALILASAFPNATYMGLPVLEQLFGNAGRAIAVQYDLFACTPLLLTLGIMVAASFGKHGEPFHPVSSLLKVPPLWAAVAAIALNVGGMPIPAWVDQLLSMLGSAVIPLMLISLGMGLQWSGWKKSQFALLIPAILLQLMVMPFVVLFMGQWLGLKGEIFIGAVLEAAMPSMVLGLVLCDRYGLNTALYAMTVTLTTALALFTLPLWFNWVS